MKVYIITNTSTWKESAYSDAELKTFLNKEIKAKKTTVNFHDNIPKQGKLSLTKANYIKEIFRHLKSNQFHEVILNKFRIGSLILNPSNQETFSELYRESRSQKELESFNSKKNYYSITILQNRITVYVSNLKTDDNGFLDFYHTGISADIKHSLNLITQLCKQDFFTSGYFKPSLSSMMSSNQRYYYPKRLSKKTTLSQLKKEKMILEL